MLFFSFVPSTYVQSKKKKLAHFNCNITKLWRYPKNILSCRKTHRSHINYTCLQSNTTQIATWNVGTVQHCCLSTFHFSIVWTKREKKTNSSWDYDMLLFMYSISFVFFFCHSLSVAVVEQLLNHYWYYTQIITIMDINAPGYLFCVCHKMNVCCCCYSLQA